MAVSKHNIFRLAIGFVTLFTLLAALGCRGFFTKPVLTGITVGPPSPTVGQGSTLQMTATGTFDDGSTDRVSNVSWSSSSPDIATISSSGVVTGVATGSTTITATSGSISGTVTLNVTNGNLTAITISPANPVLTSGQQQAFTATATVGGQTTDVTNSVTWSSSNTSVATITSGGVATAQTVTTTQQTTISATSGTVVARTTLTVNP